MKPIKGLFQDIRPHDQPDGTSPFGKNGIQNFTKQAVMNEPGTSSSFVNLPYPLNGVIEVDNAKAVVFTTDNVNSEIGFYDRTTSTYTRILRDADLDRPMGFNLKFPITGEFQRNSLNEVIVVWTNKVSNFRILNCDVPGVTKLNQLDFFLHAQTPTIKLTTSTGGILEKGAYFIGLKYMLNDGSQTDVVAFSRPAIISTTNTGTLSDKAILINLTNLDQNYNFVQIVIIAKIGGTYKSYTGPQLPVTPTSINYTYTGEELFPTATLEELLIPSATYSKVGTVAQLNDALYIADLEKEPELDLQQFANLVKLRVKSELIDIIPQTPDHVNGDKRSLMHQEVYAVYIRYHKTVGGWTKAFIIPGNTPISGDLASSSGVHNTDLGAKVFQVEDTNRNINSATQTCDTGIWRNTDEVYPNVPSFNSLSLGGRDLRGLQVLHHRMPSLAFCKSNFYPGEPQYGKTKMDILSLQVSNVTIPAALNSIIDGYEILIAKRTVGNSLVQGQSLLLAASQPSSFSNSSLNYGSTGGNWHSVTVNDVGNSGQGNFSSDKGLVVTGRSLSGFYGLGPQTAKPGLRFRFHGFDVLFSRPAIAPKYLSPQLKMRVNGINTEATGYLEDGMLADARVPVMWIADYTKGITPTVVTTDKRVRAITNTRYVANNANTIEINNTNLETVFTGNMKWIGLSSDITNNDLPLDIGFSTVNKSNAQKIGQRPDHEETYLVNLMDIKANVYDNFYSQRLISSATFIPITTPVGSVYVGDTFISEYTFHTYGWFDSENHPGNNAPDPNVDGGYKIVRRFICEAVSNIALRYEVDGNIYSKWWPHDSLVPQPVSKDGYLYSFDRNLDPNQFGYSRDLNALNEFGNFFPFNPYLIDITKFPYRIHRGGTLPKQGQKRSWRTLLPLDYHEAQKNMGRIVRMIGMEDKLLIHHENALFRTQDKVKLESDILSVTLGSGDIFQFEPQEALASKQGFAGTQHELAAVLTPVGYVFVDAKQGQVFLYNNGVKLINNGMSAFLQEQLKNVATATNPFNGNGITIGYDPEFKRIILTVKNMVVVSGLANFVPNYQPTIDFISTLTAGVSIVYKDGRYELFRGFNDTIYECPGTNHSPVATCGGASLASVAEGVPLGFVVSSVIPSLFSDPDGNALTYTITSGNVGNAFFLDPTTGILYTNGDIDFETLASYSLVIRATDPGGLFVQCTKTVSVTDVNFPPKTFNQEFIVADDITIGGTVGTLTGSGTEGHAITFSLDASSPAAPFAISSAGVITTTATLNAAVASVYQIFFRVTDVVNSLFTIAMATIYVIPGEGGVKKLSVFVPIEATGHTITDVKYNAVSIVPDVSTQTFPVVPGELKFFYANKLATATLVVSATGASGGSIVVVDANGVVTCQNYTGAGDYTFTGFNTNGTSHKVTVTYQTITC